MVKKKDFLHRSRYYVKGESNLAQKTQLHYRFKCATVSKNLARSTEQALEFITNHQSDPEKWTAQKIADDYKMKPKLVEHILHHFETYNVFIADQNSKQTLLTQTKRKLLSDKPKSQS